MFLFVASPRPLPQRAPDPGALVAVPAHRRDRALWAPLSEMPYVYDLGPGCACDVIDDEDVADTDTMAARERLMSWVDDVVAAAPDGVQLLATWGDDVPPEHLEMTPDDLRRETFTTATDRPLLIRLFAGAGHSA